MEGVRVLLFAGAREAAGTSAVVVPVGEAPVLGALRAHLAAAHGAELGAVLAVSRLWVNGDEPERGDDTPLRAGDEVAVLPPVSGG